MLQISTNPEEHARFKLHFSNLFSCGPDYSFPCDAHGAVDPGALSATSRANYLRAWSLVGQQFCMPFTTPFETPGRLDARPDECRPFATSPQRDTSRSQ
jgi:hypothetical protein